jgi:tetratricopeptide (TPR) repeat protein
MRRLFGKATQPEAGALVEERWSSSFGLLRQKRFPSELTQDYSATVRRGRLELEIHKTSAFAWVVGPYKYRDFVLEGRLTIDPGNGHSAAGFVFRHVNDENFYYFLVSNRGYFRLDVVFNRTPFHLIEWTPTPLASGEPLELRALVRGDRFAFFIDDEWIAEATDDTIPNGAIGFGAQNYEERPQGRFFLHHVMVESRPVEVEKQYYRWVHVVPARPEYRTALARSFLSMGKPIEALGQLRRSFDRKEAGAENFLLEGQAYLQAGLYTEALGSLDRCLNLEPKNTQASINKADALYLSRNYLAARDYIKSILEGMPDLARDPLLHNLLGGCEYSLGNWERSEASYRTASDLDPENPLYKENLARSLERLDRRAEASLVYLEAARLLFNAQIHDELSLVIARAKALLTPGDNTARLELRALEGKMLYQEGEYKRAEAIFQEVLDEGGEDSTVDYLYGLILIDSNRRSEAERYLARAAEREGSYALYWFRLAENRHLVQAGNGGRESGTLLPPPDDALERAYSLSPEDPWINNLYGQLLMDRGEVERALEFFRRALEYVQRAQDAADRSVAVYRNHADALLRLGRHREAVELINLGLEVCGEHPELLNLRGNSRVELDQFVEAREDYERALKLDPDNLDFMGNCATCCLELDLILRAEELLNRILEERPTAWAYNLTGSLAMRKNEHDRARLAFEEALKLEPRNPEILLNLVSLQLDQGRYEQAKELLGGVLAVDSQNRRALELQARLRDRFESRLVCDACGREWWVPRELPPQPGFSIHGEPPGEAPAGRCGSCGGLYCIACTADHVEGRRLLCPRCREPLRISEEPLKYLLLQLVDRDGPVG